MPPLPDWAAWAVLSLLGACVAVGLETYMRWAPPDQHYPWWFILPAIVLNLVLWHAFRQPFVPSLVLAVAGFNLGTLAARAVVMHYILHEPLARGNLAALFLLVGAVVLSKLWR